MFNKYSFSAVVVNVVLVIVSWTAAWFYRVKNLIVCLLLLLLPLLLLSLVRVTWNVPLSRSLVRA